MPDVEPFKSPVDGTVVTGRKSLREHNLRNNVTNAADFKETWANAAKERERLFTADPSLGRRERIEALKHAWEKHRRRK